MCVHSNQGGSITVSLKERQVQNYGIPVKFKGYNLHISIQSRRKNANQPW